MKPGFVGTTTVSSPTDLESLLKNHAGDKGWYFLRWAHTVSGFKRALPSDFERAEGQMFTGDRELRWKPQGKEFNVLLLSSIDLRENLDRLKTDLKPVAGDWITQDWDAHVYPPNETRLPRGIAYNGVNVGQRYFIDQTTWTVHFVSLIAKEGK